MSSLFGGINVALRALQAQQTSIQLIEQNVANANTPGYHRQEAVMSSDITNSGTIGYNSGGVGQIGSGVMVEKLKRYSVDFMDARYRNQTSDASNWSVKSDLLTQVESLMAEKSTSGITSQLSDFWNQWGALSNDPSNTTLRTSVLASAKNLAQSFNNQAAKLDGFSTDLNAQIAPRVQEINDLASQVANLNGQISSAVSANTQPNDLLDKRDQALDRLSELAGITYHNQDNGEVLVSIDGHVLVNGQDSYKLVTKNDTTQASVEWADGGQYTSKGGELAGVLSVRDDSNLIKDMQKGLNETAYAVIKAVNSIHNPPPATVPPTTKDIFVDLPDSTNAAGLMRINPNLTASDLLAGTSGAPGDGSIALSIANIQSTAQASLGGSTINDYYTGQVANFGVQVKQSNDSAQNSQTMASALGTQRESFTGVNLDEEAANLANAQKSYQAASRVFNAIDEMLDRVINNMGLVGR
ncbi:MAG TPA: flagellar hook-associated protein FlgK [Leptolinea sp.]